MRKMSLKMPSVSIFQTVDGNSKKEVNFFYPKIYFTYIYGNSQVYVEIIS